MKTYFVCSDIHGFYKEWVKSLKEAGFNKNNPEHILIVLGDIFDRGIRISPKSLQRASTRLRLPLTPSKYASLLS